LALPHCFNRQWATSVAIVSRITSIWMIGCILGFVLPFHAQAQRTHMSYINADTTAISRSDSLTLHLLDSVRMLNRNHFHTFRSKESEPENLLPEEENNTSWSVINFYVVFSLFLLGIYVFARAFPFQFKLQLKGFYHRVARKAMLEQAGNSWVEGEKIFPFISIAIFMSYLFFYPLVSSFIHHEKITIAVLIGAWCFSLVYLFNRLLQIIFSYLLDINAVMDCFNKSSFNTLFFIAIVCFPLMFIWTSIQQELLPISHQWILMSLVSVYIIRCTKSLYVCHQFELRQIMYLIIYLCTFEIPLLMMGFKWISDKVII
jgi:hypothetical protein